jgi:hypothetical protein
MAPLLYIYILFSYVICGPLILFMREERQIQQLII